MSLTHWWRIWWKRGGRRRREVEARRMFRCMIEDAWGRWALGCVDLDMELERMLCAWLIDSIEFLNVMIMQCSVLFSIYSLFAQTIASSSDGGEMLYKSDKPWSFASNSPVQSKTPRYAEMLSCECQNALVVLFPSFFLQKFFRFVDFRGQVRASPSVRVIQQHELTVVFADFVFR